MNLFIYFGAETSYDPDKYPTGESAIKVFDILLKPLSKGHHLFADRYYTTYNLVDHLLKEHFFTQEPFRE